MRPASAHVATVVEKYQGHEYKLESSKSGKFGYTKKQEERHFRGVITLEECNIEDINEDEFSKSKDKKKSGDDPGKGPSLMFKITNKVQYNSVLKDALIFTLKVESLADKTEWTNKIGNVIQPSKGTSGKHMDPSKGGSVSIRQSLSDGSLDTMPRNPTNPEQLRWMSQDVRGYVEAVLNNLAANILKAVVLCQIEKAKEDMLNQLYTAISSQSTLKIEELIQEDQNVKAKRDHIQKQSSLLSKLTRHLSVHDNQMSDGGTECGQNEILNLEMNGEMHLMQQQTDRKHIQDQITVGIAGDRATQLMIQVGPTL